MNIHQYALLYLFVVFFSVCSNVNKSWTETNNTAQQETDISYSSWITSYIDLCNTVIQYTRHTTSSYTNITAGHWHLTFMILHVWVLESDATATLTVEKLFFHTQKRIAVNSEVLYTPQLKCLHFTVLSDTSLEMDYCILHHQMDVCTCTWKMYVHCRHMRHWFLTSCSHLSCISFLPHTSSILMPLLTPERPNKDLTDDDITLKQVRQRHLSGYKALASG